MNFLTIILMAYVSLLDVDFNYLFHHYQNHFGKSYQEHEYNYRLDNFIDNAKHAWEFNMNNNASYTLGITPYSDMSHDEFSSYMNFNGFMKSRGCDDMNYDSMMSLPESMDWRDYGAVTSVKDQGQCGSCWSFSSTGAIEGVNAISGSGLVDLSEQQLVDCAGGIYRNHGCNGGLMDFAFNYVMDNGQCLYEDYPYTATKGDCEECSSYLYLKGCMDVPASNELALKEAVSQQPVSVAIEADTRVFQLYDGGILTSDACGTNLDHGVLTVGYGEEDGVKYWIVKNSWGQAWGESGYIRIGRSESESSDGVCGIAMQPSFPTL